MIKHIRAHHQSALKTSMGIVLVIPLPLIKSTKYLAKDITKILKL